MPGDLIGYQRPEVRQHVQEITEYLDGDQVLFPNPIIIALPIHGPVHVQSRAERQ